MADEPDNDAEGPADAAPEPEQPRSDEHTQDAAEQPAAEASADADAQPNAEAPAEADALAESDAPAEAEAEGAGSQESEVSSAGEPRAGAGEPAEKLPPKQARRRRRSTHAGQARPQRSPEERHAERQQERASKAARRRARRLAERAKAAERRAAAPPPEPLPPVHAPVEGTRRVRQGVVVSDKAAKTITVRIDVARRHRRYEKIVRSSSTVHAHDEDNDAHEGDVVRVIESRPLSRTKRWALVDVLERAR